MLPNNGSSGGLDLLRRSSNGKDPIAALNDSISVLTSSVGRLNESISDLVDLEDDNSITSGRRKPRRNSASRAPVFGVNRNVNNERMKPKRGDAIPFNTFEGDKPVQDFEAISSTLRTIAGIPRALENLTRSLVSKKDNPDDRRVDSTGLLALLAAAGITATVMGVSNAAAVGVQQGREGRNALDSQGSARDQGTHINQSPGQRALGPVSPEQQRLNRELLDNNSPITPEEERAIRENRALNSPMTFRQDNLISAPTPNDASPADDLNELVKLIKNGGDKNDAYPDEPTVVPYYDRGRPAPNEYETPAFAPLLAQAAGAGMAGVEGGAIIGGAVTQRQQSLDRSAEAGLVDSLREVVGGIRSLVGSRDASPNESQELQRNVYEMQQDGRYPVRAPGEVSTAPVVTTPDAPPAPTAPVTVPRVAAPDAPPAPTAPVTVPRVAAPEVAPTLAGPSIPPRVNEADLGIPAPAAPISVPRPAAPSIADAGVAPPPAIAAVPQVRPMTVATPHTASIAPPQTPLPLPPPAPAPIPPSRPQTIIMQAPSPPAYTPPQINMPRATGSGNMGRGVGFAPTPQSPSSPTARTPSYPARFF